MVTHESVEKQLKRLKFNTHGWGRSETRELPNILLPDEEIYEVVNGFYEAGFALLVATDVRVLLVDKKPLNYLTVEDFRFEMINEIDYSHRLFGAHISLSAGNKNLKFTSYNQARLRKLISHVQHCIADTKKQQVSHAQDQKLHLEQINQRLQAYLLAQHKNQQEIREHLTKQGGSLPPEAADVLEPTPELKDYMFAQSLLAEYNAKQAEAGKESLPVEAVEATVGTIATRQAKSDADEIYAEGMREIFGKHQAASPAAEPTAVAVPTPPAREATILTSNAQAQTNASDDASLLWIAYSKLPMAMRNRRFGSPSFHSHSKAASAHGR